MDISTLNFILLVALSTLIIFITFRKQSTNTDQINDEDVVSKILLALTKETNKNSQEQNQILIENLQKLEKRFGEQQNGIDKNFSTLRESNQESLRKIQDHLQKRLAEGIETLTKTNKEKLNEIQKEVDKRLDENFEKNLKSVQEVNKNLTQMQETAKRMIDSTKSVDKLNTIFERTSSKSFGEFGEKYLESLLSETLAQGSWQKQVTIPGSQDKIDFVIEIEDKKIGIDSKFPVTKYKDYIEAPTEEKEKALKAFKKSVMFMAKSIADKYNKENFLDVLLIYLPSESMFSDIVNDEQVSQYLSSKQVKVTPTSPNNIYPLLQTLRTYQFNTKISENAERIIAGLKVVRKNIDSFQEEFRKLGDKLRHAQDNYDKADRNLIGVQKEVLRLEQVDGEVKLEAKEADTIL